MLKSETFVMKTILFTLLALLSFGLSSQTFSLSDSTLKKGDVLILDELPFDFNKDKIIKKAQPFLDSLVDFLVKHDSVNIEIGRHSDTRGNYQYYSRCLSCNRASNIARYLMSKGIAKSRLTHKGYNGDRPLISNKEIKALKTEEEKEKAHQVNRRTEFRITSVK